VVVELSDFQCPACRTHVLETQPAIDEQLIEEGQAMWVMKHLPLSEHRRSPLAAAAAECAGDQERFWEMHELLYSEQDSWAEADGEDHFLQLAESLDLELTAFENCLNGRVAMDRVVSDMFDAQEAGIFTTPTFIMLYGGDAILLNGSRETSEFVALLQNALESTNESK
jgi:protein-disulfide isomerase